MSKVEDIIFKILVNIIKFFKIIKRKIKEKIGKDMETKTNKANNFLLEEYSKGRLLQVDNKINNLEFFRSENCKDYLNKLKNPQPQQSTKNIFPQQQ